MIDQKNKGIEFVADVLQLAWVLGGWMIPMIAFNLIFGRRAEFALNDQRVVIAVGLASFAMFVLGIFGGILVNIGDAQDDSAKERLIYTLVLPLYPFWTTVRSVVWIWKNWRRMS